MPRKGHARAAEEARITRRFSENARRARETRSLTQGQVGYRSGLKPAEISRLERGMRNPRLVTVIRLARGIGVDPAELLDGMS